MQQCVLLLRSMGGVRGEARGSLEQKFRVQSVEVKGVSLRVIKGYTVPGWTAVCLSLICVLFFWVPLNYGCFVRRLINDHLLF